jgi:hypothetical protein
VLAEIDADVLVTLARGSSGIGNELLTDVARALPYVRMYVDDH